MFDRTLTGIEVLGLIQSLSQQEVSGQLVLEIDNFSKIVHFWSGKVVFATSNLMDDRLGEVIYREGRISLEKFEDTAGKVRPGLRFGDVLLKNGFFTMKDLWDCLHSQVHEILLSLSFYPSLTARFQESDIVPKNEFPIDSELKNIFRKAQSEAKAIAVFERLATSNPSLELDESALALTTSDFQRDTIALVKDHKDFVKIVDRESRLSRVYTIRTLYSLYTDGFLKDTLSLHKTYLSDASSKAYLQVIEDANFMFAELENAANKENISDWRDVLIAASKVMEERLGHGCFVKEGDGFLSNNILRACVSQERAKESYFENVSDAWPEGFLSHLQDTLYSTILFMLFGLFNNKFQSLEFMRIKELVDQMHGNKVVL